MLATDYWHLLIQVFGPRTGRISGSIQTRAVLYGRVQCVCAHFHMGIQARPMPVPLNAFKEQSINFVPKLSIPSISLYGQEI